MDQNNKVENDYELMVGSFIYQNLVGFFIITYGLIMT